MKKKDSPEPQMELADVLFSLTEQVESDILGRKGKNIFTNSKIWFFSTIAAMFLNVIMLIVIIWQRTYINDLIDKLLKM